LKFKGMKHLLYFNLGKIERRRTNFSGAKSYYQKALEEADSDPRLVLNRKSLKGKINSSLGRLFAEMGNQEEGSVGKMHLSKAAESFIMAFKSDRSRIFDLRRAALIQIRIGNKKEAQKTLQTFLSQNPPKHYQTWALRKIRTLSEPGKF
ncbi:MAG: tetratricopeptide repeat protein, partial [Nitrospinota bacterium]